MTDPDIHLAVETWESLFRAQATIYRQLSEVPFRSADLQVNEYGVLHALSSARRGLRMTDLGKDVLLSQAGMSRLVLRLEGRGLVERTNDPNDGRACRLSLTAEGRKLYRRVGSLHARQVADLMNVAMTRQQLETLRDLCRKLALGTPLGPRSQEAADSAGSRKGADMVADSPSLISCATAGPSGAAPVETS